MNKPEIVVGAEPDPAAVGVSTTEYCRSLPKRRWSHEAKGLLLFMPRTGMVMVPDIQRPGSWHCVVVAADRALVYKPSGYSLDVGDDEIETAIELDITHAIMQAEYEHQNNADL